MAGLACGEVSAVAWEVLATGAHDFATISEDAVPATMQWLASGDGGAPTIEAGESAVAGLAALSLAKKSAAQFDALQLSDDSRVLILGTEGATDMEIYRQLVGQFDSRDLGNSSSQRYSGRKALNSRRQALTGSLPPVAGASGHCRHTVNDLRRNKSARGWSAA